MKSIISYSTKMVAIATTLLSFSPGFGGEGFEISLNNKVLIQRYGPDINQLNNLQLDKSSSGGQLTISYHHCRRVGKNRNLSIKDQQNKVVKEWHFTDAGTTVSPMSCDVKDILALKKANSNVFKLYYSSSELPNGRLLTTIILANGTMAGSR